MDTKIRIVTGNKGGVGKSMISMLMADYMIRNGRAGDILCGDAEMSELQRTYGSQMKASGLVPHGMIRSYDFMSDKGMEDFIDDMGDLDGKTAIIDTGANLQGYLMKQAGFLADCRDDMGAELGVVFVVSPSEESAVALQDFVLNAGKGFRMSVILTGPEDVAMGEYALFKNPEHDGTRMFLEKIGGKIHFLGTVPDRFFQLMMRGERKLPAKLLEDLEGRAIKRRFAGWISERVDPVMAEILGAGDA